MFSIVLRFILNVYSLLSSLLFAIESLAGLVGGASLSSFVNVVLKAWLLKRFLTSLKENKSLKITLLSTDILLNDAEKKHLKEPNVMKWLDELKEVIFAMNHTT
ncbi:hypothetical protein TorRG33x02_178560 [Trema orientale]|uniref:Disease resistance N-terminal domain-containing protein n=1 Tax=Trema orientale TaxID=63057 RepID=A0A2P5EL67_TREOI|nr:hypothetical protein TorRG33x02_178560 [Trema orientale]